MQRVNSLILFPLLLTAVMTACSLPESSVAVSEEDIYFSELDTTDWDWDDATHGKLSDSEVIDNMNVIFDNSKVQKLRIVIEPENWDLMESDLEYLSDRLGSSTDFNTVEDPMWFPCEVFYEGTEWYKVGVRFKGNSSLYNANCSKLPFKLDFDEFEDEYTDIDNQRFYGFKQLNLKNNYDDESEMHEVVAGELYRDFGLVGAHSSFFELYLNVEGTDGETDDIYFGLYTLVEEVDDTVIDLQYDEDDGTLYKPEDDAATFAYGTYDEDEYNLKTDDDESCTDIALLYNMINSSTRTTDPETWQANLEAVFDVDIFLKTLAATSVMQNWDTYGVMPHNYYLYNNPETSRFEWIAWDNNEALVDNNRCLNVNMSSVDENWPLIRYLMDLESYETIYRDYVNDFADSLFNESRMDSIFEYYEELIEDYVIDEDWDYTFTSPYLFEAAVNELKDHTTDRYLAARDYYDS